MSAANRVLPALQMLSQLTGYTPVSLQYDSKSGDWCVWLDGCERRSYPSPVQAVRAAIVYEAALLEGGAADPGEDLEGRDKIVADLRDLASSLSEGSG